MIDTDFLIQKTTPSYSMTRFYVGRNVIGV